MANLRVFWIYFAVGELGLQYFVYFQTSSLYFTGYLMIVSMDGHLGRFAGLNCGVKLGEKRFGDISFALLTS